MFKPGFRFAPSRLFVLKSKIVKKNKMARPKGFEPLASASGGPRSIQLSYGRVMQGAYYTGYR